jgi:phenylpropionate dioxygenase-like ring-hydroxylating dioxygenase large terminal subunit
LSEEVAEPDCTPVRTTLFGERLVVFRDTSGKVAVVDERCPHRLASLALGRNEEGGLRCIYHGWKFDATGACVDMPTEPGALGFRDRMKLRSYPAREAGGMVWTYLGPAEHLPAFPEYDWMKLPRSHYALIKVGERVNYAQAIEGAIDSSHSWFLHQGIIWDWQKRAATSVDTSPRMEAEDTDYGFRYAAIRVPVQNPKPSATFASRSSSCPSPRSYRGRSIRRPTRTRRSSFPSTTNGRSSTASSSPKTIARSTRPQRGASTTWCPASTSTATGTNWPTKRIGSTRIAKR